MSDDGTFTYRLRETPLTTQMYAQILVALANDIASMFENASNGKFDRRIVYDELIGYLRDEMDKPTATTDQRMLQ